MILLIDLVDEALSGMHVENRYSARFDELLRMNSNAKTR
jgi:hypothetical protein